MYKILTAVGLLFVGVGCTQLPSKSTPDESQKATSEKVSEYLTDIQQWTFAGRRTGEAYFNKTGSKIIFQSEREKGNPFYQIYVKDMLTGKENRLSPGYGKTTCAWIHPNDRRALFSSTHSDPKSRQLQKEEYATRKSGKKRRYAWDYDENFEIYETDLKGRKMKRLTKAKGYDAEGSYSPDGRWIAFASNRHAYSEKMSAEDRKMFEMNPSYGLDIYIMKSDGTQVKRLTRHKGYDGGPFFSPDGRRIVWRRFSADGHTAEVFTMNIDGSDKRQLTNLNAMSWAPFYHPSGDYIIFTTSKHGHRNFELYMIDTEGQSAPVRVTHLEGFDGLPVFTPAGDEVYWSRKYRNGESQVFRGRWDDLKAREALGLAPRFPRLSHLNRRHSKDTLKSLVHYFASPQMKGRMTGSPQERLYSLEVAQYFESIGLKKYQGSYFQEFPFVEKVLLGPNNEMNVRNSSLRLRKDWMPLSMSANKKVEPSKIAFAGYGLDIPQTEDFKAYNSYEGLNVENKWVLMFRYVPEDIETKKRQHYLRYAKIEHKVMVARQRKAKGVIIVSGPNSKVKAQIIPLRHSESSTESSLSAISISDNVAQNWLSSMGKDLGDLQSQLDKGQMLKGFDLVGLNIEGQTDIQRRLGKGRNVVGMLRVLGATKTLVIGAHGDHLGDEPRESSLARSTDTDSIHYGADDNASGMAAVLSMARHFSSRKVRKTLKQNILFVIWSGEELGTLGSHHFSKTNFNKSRFSAYLNLDMVGRLEDESLAVQGLGSSSQWERIIENVTLRSRTPIKTQEDPYLPTDAMPLYLAGVPVLSFFTGAHEEYHSPRDKAELLDYDGLLKVTRFVSDTAQQVASRSRGIKYKKVTRKSKSQRGGFRIYLGTIPDYTNNKVKGVKLSGVIVGGPAESAGLLRGDVIVEFSDMKIENIHDYVYSLQSLKPGQATKIVVLRDGRRVTMNITPSSKE